MRLLRSAYAVLWVLAPRRRRWVVVAIGGGIEQVVTRRLRTEKDARVAQAVHSFMDLHHDYEIREV